MSAFNSQRVAWWLWWSDRFASYYYDHPARNAVLCELLAPAYLYCIDRAARLEYAEE